MTDRSIAPLFTWRSAVCSSDLTPTQRHVALTLSLYMNERGGSAFPGAGRLADDCGLHVSTVRRALHDLTDAGWLELRSRGGRRGERKKANEYVACRPQPTLDVVAPPAQDDPSHSATRSTGRATPSTGRGSPLAQDDPNTPYELSKKTSTPSAGKPTRDRDLIFEALIEASGWSLDDLTKSARGRANAAAKELRELGASPEGIKARAVVHRKKWPDIDVTPNSIAANYPTLGSVVPGRAAVDVGPTCPDCAQRVDGHDDEVCRRVREDAA